MQTSNALFKAPSTNSKLFNSNRIAKNESQASEKLSILKKTSAFSLNKNMQPMPSKDKNLDNVDVLQPGASASSKAKMSMKDRVKMQMQKMKDKQTN